MTFNKDVYTPLAAHSFRRGSYPHLRIKRVRKRVSVVRSSLGFHVPEPVK